MAGRSWCSRSRRRTSPPPPPTGLARHVYRVIAASTRRLPTAPGAPANPPLPHRSAPDPSLEPSRDPLPGRRSRRGTARGSRRTSTTARCLVTAASPGATVTGRHARGCGSGCEDGVRAEAAYPKPHLSPRGCRRRGPPCPPVSSPDAGLRPRGAGPGNRRPRRTPRAGPARLCRLTRSARGIHRTGRRASPPPRCPAHRGWHRRAHPAASPGSASSPTRRGVQVRSRSTTTRPSRTQTASSSGR